MRIVALCLPVEAGNPLARARGPPCRPRQLARPSATGKHTEATMSTEERNMELMQTLDDAWNAQDVETFR